MSIQYSNTSTKNGLLQIIERRLGFNDGDISGHATRKAQFTGEINLTIDEVLGFMFPKGGGWQLDDANHPNYPIITTNLVLGQRDYAFTTDENGIVILDIYKVAISDGSVFREIKAVDQQEPNSPNSNNKSFYDGQDVSGIPTRYDKTANGIFLDPISNANVTNGLKVFINREGSYFTTSDTTKIVGFAHLFHEYFAIRPAYRYARDKQLKVAEQLKRDCDEMKAAIIEYFGMREKDVIRRMYASRDSNK
jgi:hypothetical protein